MAQMKNDMKLDFPACVLLNEVSLIASPSSATVHRFQTSSQARFLGQRGTLRQCKLRSKTKVLDLLQNFNNIITFFDESDISNGMQFGQMIFLQAEVLAGRKLRSPKAGPKSRSRSTSRSVDIKEEL